LRIQAGFLNDFLNCSASEWLWIGKERGIGWGVVKRRRILLVMVLLWLGLASAAGANEQAYAVFSGGMELEKRLQILEARERFRAALDLEPGNAGYWEHHAWFLTAHGFNEEAAAAFRRLLPLTREKGPAYKGLGWALENIGQHAQAAAAYEQAWPQAAASDRSTLLANVRKLRAGENARQGRAVQDELSRQPHSIDLQRELVRAFIDQGEPSQAIAVAETLRSREGLDPTTHLWLARALFWHGDKARSADEYRALIAAGPPSAFLHMELADVYSADERLPEARAELEKAQTLHRAPEIRQRLAEVLARLGETRSAEHLAQGIPPEGFYRRTALLARARVLHFSGRLHQARAAYADVLETYPQDGDALWGMAETSIYTGRYPQARQALDAWQSALPDARLEVLQQRLADALAPRLALKAGYYSNTSHFSRKDAGLSAVFHPQGDWRLVPAYTYTLFEQRREEIQRQAVSLGAALSATARFQVEGYLAGHFYDNDHSALNGGIGISLQAAPGWVLRSHYRHLDIIDTIAPFENTVYHPVVTIGAAALGTTSDEYGAGAYYSPTDRLSLMGEFAHGRYSDDNRMQRLVLEAAYQLAQRPDWRIAYNYFYLDLKHPAPLYTSGSTVESAYFDPRDYQSHAIRTSLSLDLTAALSCGGELALGYIPKAEGIGTTLAAFLKWRIDRHFGLRLDARWYHQNKGVDRIGRTGSFQADNVVLELEYRF
jgi:tetratricopeptide (TPR) repeat protein